MELGIIIASLGAVGWSAFDFTRKKLLVSASVPEAAFKVNITLAGLFAAWAVTAMLGDASAIDSGYWVWGIACGVIQSSQLAVLLRAQARTVERCHPHAATTPVFALLGETMWLSRTRRFCKSLASCGDSHRHRVTLGQA